jgi:hypothetical protein
LSLGFFTILDSPSTQHHPPFIAWPPVPLGHLRQSPSQLASTSRPRSHSPAQQYLAAVPNTSTSPLKHFQATLRSARNILHRNDYARVPEEDGTSGQQLQAGSSEQRTTSSTSIAAKSNKANFVVDYFPTVNIYIPN